jgi:GntR family transcriptional regulator
MLPFVVELRPGESPSRQIVYAATRAVVAGELPAGAAFPSVRELSQALKINPNTAHKVVSELVRSGILEVHPGVGTVVREGQRGTASERRRLLSREVEQLVVEARRLGLDQADVHDAVSSRWSELFGNGAGATGGADPPGERDAGRRDGGRDAGRRDGERDAGDGTVKGVDGDAAKRRAGAGG